MDNRLVVIYGNNRPSDCGDYQVENIDNDKSLSLFTSRTGINLGIFPSLVDTHLGVWVEIDGTIEESEIALSDKIQDAKTTEQRRYESSYFLLCRMVLTAVGDVRATAVPTEKLTFDELVGLIEPLQETDLNTSIKLSLKLLTIDAALKRFNLLWWDYAVANTVVE